MQNRDKDKSEGGIGNDASCRIKNTTPEDTMLALDVFADLSDCGYIGRQRARADRGQDAEQKSRNHGDAAAFQK